MALYKNNLENKEVQILKAIESISKIAKDLNTISYVWGGITTSIHQGFFYRPHHDIDLFIITRPYSVYVVYYKPSCFSR